MLLLVVGLAPRLSINPSFDLGCTWCTIRGGSVTAKIGFTVDLDLHEKLLRRIGSRWCKNHEDLDLYVCVSIHFLFSVQNQFVVHSKTLCPILHGETVI
jgi:hypothetical protein